MNLIWQIKTFLLSMIAEVSNQMLELYEQNRTTQAQTSQGSEAEGSSAGVRNPHASVKSEANSKDPPAPGYNQASKLPNSSLAGAPGHHGVGLSNSDKHISGPKLCKNDNGNHGGSKDKSSKSGIKSDAVIDRSHRDKKSSPGHHSKSNHEILNPKEEHQPHRSQDNPNETRDGVLGGNEAPGVSSSMMDAMNKIDKDKVKAALEKRRKSKGGVATNVNVIDDDDLLERELEHGVELAAEDEKVKQDKRQNLSHGSMPPADVQHVDHAMENGHNGEQSVATTADDGEFPRNSKELHRQPFDKQNDGYEHKSQQDDHSLKHDKGHDDELAKT
jgi:cyclin T